MSESLRSARKGFFRTMAPIVAVTAVISAVVFYSLGPIRLFGSAATATTRPGPADEVIRQVTYPPPVNPFAGLTSSTWEQRKEALRPRPEVDLWLNDPRTTPAMRAEAAELLVKASTTRASGCGWRSSNWSARSSGTRNSSRCTRR